MTCFTSISALLSFFHGDQYIGIPLTIVRRYREAESFRNKGKVGKARGKSLNVMAERRHHIQRNRFEIQRGFLLRQNILGHLKTELPKEQNAKQINAVGTLSLAVANFQKANYHSRAGVPSLERWCPTPVFRMVFQSSLE